MKHFRFSSRLLAVAFLTLAFASLAGAQTRTWVSGTGSDFNPCSRTAPCKTFAAAISLTSASGEIDCMDAGSFGSVTITKAITIDCGSGVGTILAPSNTNGIVVQAGPSDTVTIRNLAIIGAGTGNSGITYTSGQVLHVEDVKLSGFANCIYSSPNVSLQMTVLNTTMSECSNSGIFIFTAGSATVSAEVENSRIYNSGTGLAALNGTRATIRNSIVHMNSYAVLQAWLGTGGSTVTVVGSSLGSSSVAALQSASGAFLLAFGNTFLNNAMIYSAGGGLIYTGTDNVNSGNASVGTANGGNVPKV